MSRIRRILATGAIAGLALTGLAAPAMAGVNSDLNHPSYYGDDCTKREFTGDTRTYFVAPGTTVHIKAGTVIHHFEGGLYGQTVTLPKGISFVITCGGGGYPPS